MTPSRTLDPESRSLGSTPEAVAAECFRSLHPDERVLYTRVVRHGHEPIVVIAHGDLRPPLRLHYLVDIDHLTARELDEKELAALLPPNGENG